MLLMYFLNDFERVQVAYYYYYYYYYYLNVCATCSDAHCSIFVSHDISHNADILNIPTTFLILCDGCLQFSGDC